MLTNYYTLKALLDEWRPWLEGARVLEAYSQHRGSLILVFLSGDGGTRSMNLSVQAPHRHLFVYEGSNRSRRNTVDLMPALVGRTVKKASMAERDRLIWLELDNRWSLFIVPYGPRANVLLTSAKGGVQNAFLGSASKAQVPQARPAPLVTEDTFTGVDRDARSFSRALPLFALPLAEELVHRTGPDAPDEAVLNVLRVMEAELEAPAPRYYPEQDVMATIRLRHLEEGPSARAPWPEVAPNTEATPTAETTSTLESAAPLITHQTFQTVSDAVRVVARLRLSQDRFQSRFDPLLKMLRNRRDQAGRSLRRIQEELEKPSRADQYEKWGHLLTALPHEVPAGAEQVSLPDLMGGGEPQVIKLDPTLSPIENAQRYYNRARSTRQSRASAHDRLAKQIEEAQELKQLTAELERATSSSDLDAFEEKHASRLKTLRSAPDDPDSIPYRRYVLGSGYEVWVGRNAKQNDQLTLHDARKWDYWLHARGVAGSHTVLRVPRKDEKPPRSILEQAAGIAAFHSKARTSSMAPVIVTQKKYVRKPRKGAPGTMMVEREEVILIEPSLPDAG